jgi:hypothetical protein
MDDGEYKECSIPTEESLHRIIPTDLLHNDIMFSHSINPTIHGGTFQVYHHGATIGTSEVNEGSQYLMAIT